MYIYFNKCKAINKLPPRLVGKQKKNQNKESRHKGEKKPNTRKQFLKFLSSQKTALNVYHTQKKLPVFHALFTHFTTDGTVTN